MIPEEAAMGSGDRPYDYREAAFGAYQFRHDLIRLLYEARLARGMTQDDLARRMHVTRDVIDDIETGDELATLRDIIDWVIETGIELRIDGKLMTQNDTFNWESPRPSLGSSEYETVKALEFMESVRDRFVSYREWNDCCTKLLKGLDAGLDMDLLINHVKEKYLDEDPEDEVKNDDPSWIIFKD